MFGIPLFSKTKHNSIYEKIMKLCFMIFWGIGITLVSTLLSAYRLSGFSESNAFGVVSVSTLIPVLIFSAATVIVFSFVYSFILFLINLIKRNYELAAVYVIYFSFLSLFLIPFFVGMYDNYKYSGLLLSDWIRVLL